MAIPFMAIGAGLGAVGALGKFFKGIQQNSLAKKIKPQFQQYQVSPYAKQQHATAQQQMNARMAGAGAMERNIAANQAGQISNINRNATDSSQALALASGTQGQANNAYLNMGMQEAQNKYAMLNNLNRSYGQMINEGDKVHNSIMQKYQMDVMEKNALRGAGAQNTFGGINDLGSLSMMAGQMGLGGEKDQGQNSAFGFGQMAGRAGAFGG